ncbi:FG-GAP repeat protein [Planctomycetes bacterium Pan216]|uniref:FG-GAP repeat protein n=1 Tax=Kolteria novifilia TaxID=2527975 RepID=A0A518B7Y4_9BACT|nr:FG-GAP repeat protein [Planctomycetes bacterium Pan216]
MSPLLRQPSSRRLRPFQFETLEDRIVPFTYPNVGAFPIPQNTQSSWGSVPFTYDTFYQGFDTQGNRTLNADGTLIDNPVISTGSQKTSGDVTYDLYTLTSNPTIDFGSTTYTVYSAVPENMSIDYAYQNTSEYYPATINTAQYDFPATPPATINGGNASSLGTAAAPSPYTNEQVVLSTNPNNGSDGRLAYYIPNLPDASGAHGGLTSNVYWNLDQYPDTQFALPEPPISLPARHLEPYGWASDPRFANQSIIYQNLNETGGQVSNTTTLVQEGDPVNYWYNLLTGQHGFNQNDPPADPTNPTNPGLHHYLFNEIPDSYPFPSPTWLENGIYMPFNPKPGFQSNLVRYYTAWGAWNLLNNTSGLYVRSDGSVEIPYNTTADAAYPLVTQTWDGSQRFTVLNLTGEVIPSVATNFPFGEAYYAQNAYLPGEAGVWQSFDNYTVWDNSYAQNLRPRPNDGWLGLLGDTTATAMVWSDANNGQGPLGLQGSTEPGGQANKPYMFNAATFNDTDTGNLTYRAELKSANSFPIAEQSSDIVDVLYNASLYVDEGTGNGYEWAATLSYDWQPWTITNQNGSPVWSSLGNGFGSAIPSIKVADKFQTFVTSNVGSNWNADARTLGIAGRPYQQGDANALGSAPIQFDVAPFYQASTNPNAKFLIVLQPLTADGDPAIPRPAFATGTDAGAGPHVNVYDSNGTSISQFYAFDPSFQGGVRVAVGDVNGDGVDDIIASAGAGAGPHVVVVDGTKLDQVSESGRIDESALLASWFAYDETFQGGVFVAAGDVDGDGLEEVITGSGNSARPHVRVFDAEQGASQIPGDVGSFFAYDASFLGGVRVAAGDLDGDGTEEIITAPGEGAAPHVRAFERDLSLAANFFAYDESFRGGVFVSAGDVNGDGRADIVTGPGTLAAPHLRAFDGSNVENQLASFLAFDDGGIGGARVALFDFTGDGRLDYLATQGPGEEAQAVLVDSLTLETVDDFFAYGFFEGGTFVGAN